MKFFLIMSLCFILSISSCSKKLSPFDARLQGGWKCVKQTAATRQTGSNLLYVNFYGNNFELIENNFSNIPDHWTGNYTLRGKYNTDSSFIHFDGRSKEKNKYFNEYKPFKTKLRYIFSGDTLIIGIHGDKDETTESSRIGPDYFLKESEN